MLVFRENRVAVSTHLLVRTLAEKIAATDRDTLLDALLRAGELECALADAGSPAAAQAAKVTDELVARIVNGRAYDPAALADCLGSLHVPTKVKISPPEGFAYYALHPLDYAELALKSVGDSARVAVVGIRSIGTTLGAVVKAAFDGRGVPAQRISVRPTGHPFDRATHFSREELSWIARNRDQRTDFLVVDEGPGLSGSSFLSVGEALLRAGVGAPYSSPVSPEGHASIQFLCSHAPRLELLRARNAAERWSRFHVCAVGDNSRLPADRAVDLSGAKWRQLLYPDLAEWPASWPQMERVKFLSADKKMLFKFEGLGRFGAEVFRRARAIAVAGFGPEPQQLHDGFAAYPWLRGVPGGASRIAESLLDRLADYCAFRAHEFRTQSARNETNLAAMVRCNVREEFGFEPEIDDAALESATPVIVDGRMQPHEWLRPEARPWLKLDGGSHGDDHFYPGPTDIAWDLAGAIIEWQLDPRATEYFLSRYRHISGDDPGSRLPSFLLAYSAFRLGCCKMAAESVGDDAERTRLMRDYARYRDFAHNTLAKIDVTIPQYSVAGRRQKAAERRGNVTHGVSRG